MPKKIKQKRKATQKQLDALARARSNIKPKEKIEESNTVIQKKEDIIVEEVEVDPILTKPIENSNDIIDNEVEKTKKIDIPEEFNDVVNEELDKSYMDFCNSIHQLLYKRLLNVGTDHQIEALNRAGVSIVKKYDKRKYVEKYGDLITYGMITMEIISYAMLEKRKKALEAKKSAAPAAPTQINEIKTTADLLKDHGTS